MALPRKNSASKTIFVDTDAFVAFVRDEDVHHRRATAILDALAQQPVTFVTSNYVFAESVTVISQRVNHAAAVAFAEKLKSPTSLFFVQWVDEQLEARALDIFARQRSKNVSFVDCTNMAVVDQYNLDGLFSFDAAYRKNGYRTVADL